jgi:hypothetical protein
MAEGSYFGISFPLLLVEPPGCRGVPRAMPETDESILPPAISEDTTAISKFA